MPQQCMFPITYSIGLQSARQRNEAIGQNVMTLYIHIALGLYISSYVNCVYFGLHTHIGGAVQM